MYRQDLDALKGIAIIAVVLYHMGLLKSGYLGVDAFFVINGFLIIPTVIRKIGKNEFSFLGFLEKRVIRLLPLIVLASIVSLILGLLLMLPDDLENLSQSIIASNVMSQNILSAITTKNYWAVSNDYKPLMHFWYIGILFEFYLILPLLMLMINKLAKALKQSGEKWMLSILTLFTILSLILFLNPNVSIGDKFYYIQYRFFEIGIGGIIGLTAIEFNKSKRKHTLQRLTTTLFISIIFSSVYNILIKDVPSQNVIGGVVTTSGMPLSGTTSLLLTVFLTSIIVGYKDNGSIVLRSKWLAWMGKMSYSIFVWHQVILAFFRYSVSNKITLNVSIAFLVVTLIISCLSYYLIEKKILGSRKTLIRWSVTAALLLIPSSWLYLHAGVIKDMPELDLTKNNVHRGMFAEYCDRIYQYKEYPKENNGKINVLVEGVSFGRDFANIILESSYADSINLVYVFRWTESEEIQKLVSKSDYIFTFMNKRDVPEIVWKSLKKDAIIKGIGTKNFGACNGIIYKNRFKSNYLTQSIEMIEGYNELNSLWLHEWGEENYIDMIAPVLIEGNSVRVFTDDGKFISPDTGHLSQAGAKWYAKVLNWDMIWRR